MHMDIDIYCKSVKLMPHNGKEVYLDCQDVDMNNLLTDNLKIKDVVSICGTGEVLNEIGLKEIVSHFGIQKVLEEIGREEVKTYFGL